MNGNRYLKMPVFFIYSESCLGFKDLSVGSPEYDHLIFNDIYFSCWLLQKRSVKSLSQKNKNRQIDVLICALSTYWIIKQNFFYF
jgi:uncharacterized membrane protein YbaN (DUF454 family)